MGTYKVILIIVSFVLWLISISLLYTEVYPPPLGIFDDVFFCEFDISCFEPGTLPRFIGATILWLFSLVVFLGLIFSKLEIGRKELIAALGTSTIIVVAVFAGISFFQPSTSLPLPSPIVPPIITPTGTQIPEPATSLQTFAPSPSPLVTSTTTPVAASQPATYPSSPIPTGKTLLYTSPSLSIKGGDEYRYSDGQILKVSDGKVFYSDFSNDPSLDWATVSGNWRWNNAEGIWQVETSPGKFALAYLSNVTFQDAIIEIVSRWDKQTERGGEGPEIYLMIQGEKPIAYGFDYYGASSPPTIRLVKYTNATLTEPGVIGYELRDYGTPPTGVETLPTGKWVKMKMVVKGSQLTGYLEPSLSATVSATDNGLTTGSKSIAIGGYWNGDVGSFDYVKVSEPKPIKISGLSDGQTVELYDVNGALSASGEVRAGELSLDISDLSIPFEGYFKIYAVS